MTLDLISRRIQYVGNDETKCFSFPFRAWDTSQIRVYCFDEDKTWMETDITNRVTVTLNDNSNGGYVTFNSAPANGLNFAIVREMPFVQEDEYISGARFDAHEIEDRFDMDAAERQELLDGLNRAILIPNSSTQNPQDVYCTLICGAQTVEGYLNSLTTLYNCSLYYYNIAIGILADTTYQSTHQTCFTMESTCLNEFTYEFQDGFFYYPQTHQLLVSVDGVVLTEGCHYEDVGQHGCESSCIRFFVPLYEGQEVYIKAGFLGTQEFDLKIQCFKDEGRNYYECFEEQGQNYCKCFEDLIECVNTTTESLNTATESLKAATESLNAATENFGEMSGDTFLPAQSYLYCVPNKEGVETSASSEDNDEASISGTEICHNILYRALKDLTVSVDGLTLDEDFLALPEKNNVEDNSNEDSSESSDNEEGDGEDDGEDLYTSTVIKLPLYPGQKIYIQRGVFFLNKENDVPDSPEEDEEEDKEEDERGGEENDESSENKEQNNK